MKIKETKTWKFEELTEQQQQKAIQNYYEINVDYEWWNSTYEDAKNVGLKITGFDIDRGAYCKGDFIESPEDAAALIMDEHGKDCETYKTAAQYLHDRAKLVEKHSDGIALDIVAEDNEYDFDQDCDDLDAEFIHDILEDYRRILSKDYDYLTSEEAIKETLIINDYDFTENGKIF